jgi:hypothetical protein
VGPSFCFQSGPGSNVRNQHYLSLGATSNFQFHQVS